MNYQRRPLLPAPVGARASHVVLRHLGEPLERLAAALAQSPSEESREIASELRDSIRAMAEAARQLRERGQVAEVGNAAMPSAAGGSSSVCPPTTPPLLEVGEVAERLGRKPRQVRNLCAPGGPLSATKRGGVWLIDPDSVTDYLTSRGDR